MELVLTIATNFVMDCSPRKNVSNVMSSSSPCVGWKMYTQFMLGG